MLIFICLALHHFWKLADLNVIPIQNKLQTEYVFAMLAQTCTVKEIKIILTLDPSCQVGVSNQTNPPVTSRQTR